MPVKGTELHRKLDATWEVSEGEPHHAEAKAF